VKGNGEECMWGKKGYVRDPFKKGGHFRTRKHREEGKVCLII